MSSGTVPVRAGRVRSRRTVSAARLLIVLASSLLAIGALPGSPARTAEAECTTTDFRSGHIGIWLGGLPPQAPVTDPFYFAAEDQGVGRFQINAGADVCGESASVRFDTSDDTATAPSDYGDVGGRATIVVYHLGSPRIVEVPIVADGVAEAAVEAFRVILSAPSNGTLRDPPSAPFYVIDADGPTRASLGTTAETVEETDGSIRLVVFRAGPDDAPLTLPFEIAPEGTAPATPGEDFVVETASPLTFAAGERAVTIDLSIVQDELDEPDESLRITLDETATTTTRSATVTLLSGTDARPPRSRFHHPRQGWTYDAEDYRIRELHVFTGDGQGSGVVEVEVALRRTATDGDCAWWNGTRFAPASCRAKTWLATGMYEPGAFYYYRLDPLGPSVGTRVEHYTAYARAVDASGNLQRVFEVGENRNTFEIERGDD